MRITRSTPKAIKTAMWKLTIAQSTDFAGISTARL
jgi:hypothetical protein